MEYAHCVNNDGSYTCSCLAGFLLQNDSCIDFDECSSEPCPLHSNCYNRPGSYECQCHLGFVKQDSLCHDTLHFKVELRILNVNGTEATFNSELRNISSTEYQSLSYQVSAAVNQALYDSHYHDDYRGSLLMGFASGNGSVISHTVCLFDDSSAITENDLIFALGSNESAYQQQSLEVDEIIVSDLNECSSANWNDCSEHGDCANIVGTYTCSCLAGFVDASPDSERPGRICVAVSDLMQDPVLGLRLFVATEHHLVGAVVAFTVTSERGSHLVYTLAYGDTNVQTTTNPNMLSFTQPIIVSHMYTTAGTFVVTVTAHNDVSSMIAATSVVIQHSLINTVFVTDSIVPFPPGEVDYKLQPKDNGYVYTDLYCNIDYGNGKSKVFQIEALTDLTPWNKVYQYFLADVGQVQVELNCSNHVSSIRHSASIAIVQKVRGVNVQVQQMVMATFDRFYGNVTMQGGSLLNIEIKYGDNDTGKVSSLNKAGGPSYYSFFHFFVSPGHYIIEVNVSNIVSHSTVFLRSPIIVQNYIRDTISSIPNIVGFPPGVITATVLYKEHYFPPSEVTCALTFANKRLVELFASSLTREIPLILQYPLPTGEMAGEFQVIVDCFNLVDSISWTKQISVQRKIEGLELSVDRSFMPVNESAIFEVRFKSGSNMTLIIDYGNGNSHGLTYDPVFTNGIAYTFIEHYESVATYTVQVKAWNVLGMSSTFLRIQVLEPILGLQAGRYYIKSDITGEKNFGEGPDQNVFPKERKIYFQLDHTMGNLLTYHWDFGDGKSEVALHKSTEHEYSDTGNYTVSLTVWNALYTTSINLTLTIYETVGMYLLENDGPQEAYSAVSFTLHLSRPGTFTCYLWNMDDGTPPVMYGERHCENATGTYTLYRLWSPSSKVTHKHVYTSEGNFRVNVSAFNLISEATIHDIVVITGINCDYPEVNILGDGRNPDSPVVKYRSEMITFHSKVILKCAASSVALYNWTIQRVLPGRTYQEKIYMEYPAHQESTDKFQVFFPPRTFQVGDYVIILAVSMATLQFISRSDLVYLRVESSPLKGSIVGGSACPAGYNTDITLDAASVSYDPDYPDNNTGISYEWWCRLATETFDFVGDDIRNPTILVPSVEARQNYSVDGCFGTGIGKLTYTQGAFSLNTLILSPNSTNVFRVRVTKESRWTTFEQTLNVIDGRPHSVLIGCVINCQKKMNPSQEFALLAECTTCSRWEMPQFLWTLFKYNEANATWLPEGSLQAYSNTGTKSASMVLKPRSLSGGVLYRLHLDARLSGYTPSFSEYEFKTNLPPYGGNCSIWPKSGYALLTKFVIGCDGWKNPDTDAPTQLVYRFWALPRGQSLSQLLYYGPEPYMPESQLPLASKHNGFMIDIAVRIAVPLGEFTETYFQVRVEEPPAESVLEKELLDMSTGEDSQLAIMLASGQSQEAKQLVVALASLLNSQPLEASATRSTTTTATITPSTTTEQDGITTNTYGRSMGEVTKEKWSFTTGNQTIHSMSDEIMTVTGYLSTSGLLRSSTLSTTFTPSTTMDAAALAEKQRQERQAKAMRTQLRTSVIKTLAKTKSYTLDSLQQTALAFKAITQETDEITEESQIVTVSVMENMAADLDIVLQQDEESSTDQALTTANDIIGSLGNVLIAAKEDLISIQESTMGIHNDIPADPSNAPDEQDQGGHPGTDVSQEQMQENKDEPTAKTKSKVRELTTTALQIADTLAKSVLNRQLPEEPPVHLTSSLFTMVLERHRADDLGKKKISTDSGSFLLPPAKDIFGVNYTVVTLDTKVIASKTNPFIWDESAENINPAIISLKLADKEGTNFAVNNTINPFVIDIALNQSAIPEKRHVVPEVPAYQELYIHSFYVKTNGSALQIQIIPDDQDMEIEVYVRHSKFPTTSTFDLNFTLPNPDVNMTDARIATELRHSVFLPASYISLHGIEDMFLLGIRPKPNESEEMSYEEEYYQNYVYGTNDQEKTRSFPNLTIRLLAAGCRFWHQHRETWLVDGCKVSAVSNSLYTRCLCYHLTAFGADFFVPPNTINWSTVFEDMAAKLRDNHAVLVTVACMVGVYLLVLVWARHKDRLDVSQWGVTPLEDNVVGERYFYQLSVYTGMRKAAGTKSNVHFVLSGDQADTGVRQLQDKKKKYFARGSINHYLMSVPESLGQLSFLRIWHDNSGAGKYASWYLDRIIVTDLQTFDRFFFIASQWFAVEEGDGQIDRLLPVSGSEDVAAFGNLFASATRKRLTDSHLWISVISRPTRSNFTRVQRVSCILSLIFTTMLANAMFFRAEEKVEVVHVMSVGPFKFTLHQIWVSFASSMIIFPVNLLIDQIFRRSTPKSRKTVPGVHNQHVFNGTMLNPWFTGKEQHRGKKKVKTTPVTTIEPSKKSEDENDSNLSREFSKPSNNTVDCEERGVTAVEPDPPSIGPLRPSSRLTAINSNMVKSENQTAPQEVKLPSHLLLGKKRKKKVKLPSWCVYVAWFLVLLSTGASAFFTVMYSIEWGKEKSEAWLTAMLLSIVESVILIQPTKIIMIAITISLLIKHPEVEEDPAENENDFVLPKVDEEITDPRPRKRFRERIPIETPDETELAHARERRLKEVEMQRVLREVVAYCVFLGVLLMLAHYNVDTRSYHIHHNVINTFWHSNPSFEKVKDPGSLWQWVTEILVPNLYPDQRYNGDSLHGHGRIAADMVAYRLGPPRLRQLRIKPDLCDLPARLRPYFHECNLDYSIAAEERGVFEENWHSTNQNHSESLWQTSAWRYIDTKQLDGLPYVGQLAVYQGGGYVRDLLGSHSMANRAVSTISSTSWIDKYTRAVFFEFTLYNPNVNLFTIVTFLVELPVAAGAVHSRSVSSFRLLTYADGSSVFVLIAEIIYLCVVCYYVGSVTRRLRRLGLRAFFCHYWCVMDVLMVLTSIAVIVMYLGRHAYTKYAMKQVKKLKGSFYNFGRLAVWSSVFANTVGVVCFLSILRLIHILRFNKKMSMLSSTLKRAAGEMSTFSIVFLVVVLAYADFAYLVFGRQLVTYSSFLSTLQTLLSTSLGTFNYRELCMAGGWLGPTYFFSYVLIMIFLLLNMFVSIISDSFSAVKHSLRLQSNQYEIVDYMWGRIECWTGLQFLKLFSSEDRQNKYKAPEDNKKRNDLESVDKQISDIHARITYLYQDLCRDAEPDSIILAHKGKRDQGTRTWNKEMIKELSNFPVPGGYISDEGESQSIKPATGMENMADTDFIPTGDESFC